ncbi:hypothetical protein HHK36_030729 [Tetracentron sinense]|uniref:DUF7870 domain-containing protein n=1 Tax=Tetracentron sinense TaxID=13715 RepID=A0A835CYX9_TETSI|nr:hypothetical protein HHK36_030729 [Tetracentron sinense]
MLCFCEEQGRKKGVTMELASGFRAKQQGKIKHLYGRGIDVNSDNQLTIKLLDSRVLRVVARSVFLALVIVTFPWIGSIIGGSLNSYRGLSETGTGPDWSNVGLLPMLFRDLAKEGLFREGDKALYVSTVNEKVIENSQILNDNEMDLISDSDFERQSSIPDDTFNFMFVSGFRAAEFIDRTLKTGGIAAIQLTDDPLNPFIKPPNYKIVYLRRFNSTIVAMRKTGRANVSMKSPTKRRLFAFASEAKKAALKGLEDVLLEPPRAASAKSNKYLKRTKYLPDLTGDSLEGYPRRVFIDVGLPDKNSGNNGWFARNYPTRNRNFEMYKIETVTEESSGKAVPQIGMSDWIRKNVREEEYVVMKAEAEVVEEMVKSKTICLVDELFLECKHQGLGRKNKSRRAYWECLALYGKLRDEGVAVHQWWG